MKKSGQTRTAILRSWEWGQSIYCHVCSVTATPKSSRSRAEFIDKHAKCLTSETCAIR